MDVWGNWRLNFNRGKNEMNMVQKNQFKQFNYIDPELLLRSITPTVLEILQKSKSVKHLTGNQEKHYLEAFEAGVLAFMAKRIAGSFATVTVCVIEKEDYDCVIKAVIEGEIVYRPVQLKRLPSHKVNNKSQIQITIDKLKNKYQGSTVAIWIQRDIELDFGRLKFDGLSVEQLWFFGNPSIEEITLHGGFVSDLSLGNCWEGIIKNGMPQIRKIKFRRN